MPKEASSVSMLVLQALTIRVKVLMIELYSSLTGAQVGPSILQTWTSIRTWSAVTAWCLSYF